MCVTCGCGGSGGALISGANGEHEHIGLDGKRYVHSHGDHGGGHGHVHALSPAAGAALAADGVALHGFAPLGPAAGDVATAHAPEPLLQVPGRDSHTIHLEQQILEQNHRVADRVRNWLSERGILALNLVSSPGAGKTTLLERTLTDLRQEMRIAVVEGDQATSNDAERIRATGVKAVQVNTGTGCHLEAEMLERALALLAPQQRSLLLVENVGNLVCPALFDLGERAKVVIFSVTEGEDKPLKYPHMFAAAEVLLLSKIDLVPHIRIDVERAVANALQVNPRLRVFRVSSYTGEGMAQWYGWLRAELDACRSVAR
jgi:hydrogenase nickel incorporation protein HypB